MGVRQEEVCPSAAKPGSSGLASVQGLRITPRPDTEVSYGDETQAN